MPPFSHLARGSVLIALSSCSAEPHADVGQFTTLDADTSDASDGLASTGDPIGSDETSHDESEDGGDETTGTPPKLDVGGVDSGEPGDCDPTAENFMMLLDNDGSLHRFDPETLEVTPLGPLACEGAAGAMSSALARDGMLWVMMYDEIGYRWIYTVDPETLECQPTNFVDPGKEGYVPFSLGFVADGVDAKTETLYINVLVAPGGGFGPNDPSGLMVIPDRTTMDTHFVGVLPVPNTSMTSEVADLEGTGEGRMFGLFSSSPATLAEVDVATAEFVWDTTLDFDTGLGWGFAQWAGELFVFTATGTNGHSQLRTVDPMGGESELLSEDVGLLVVGAAVSTCAPYQPRG